MRPPSTRMTASLSSSSGVRILPAWIRVVCIAMVLYLELPENATGSGGRNHSRACIRVLLRYNQLSPKFGGTWNVIRQALRGAEAPAATTQNREGESEALRAREDSTRQTPLVSQEVSDPQTAGAQQSRIIPDKKKGVPLNWDALLLHGRSRQGDGSLLRLVSGGLCVRSTRLRYAQVTDDLILGDRVDNKLERRAASILEEIQRLVGRPILLFIELIVKDDA